MMMGLFRLVTICCVFLAGLQPVTGATSPAPAAPLQGFTAAASPSQNPEVEAVTVSPSNPSPLPPAPQPPTNPTVQTGISVDLNAPGVTSPPDRYTDENSGRAPTPTADPMVTYDLQTLLNYVMSLPDFTGNGTDPADPSGYYNNGMGAPYGSPQQVPLPPQYQTPQTSGFQGAPQPPPQQYAVNYGQKFYLKPPSGTDSYPTSVQTFSGSSYRGNQVSRGSFGNHPVAMAPLLGGFGLPSNSGPLGSSPMSRRPSQPQRNTFMEALDLMGIIKAADDAHCKTLPDLLRMDFLKHLPVPCHRRCPLHTRCVKVKMLHYCCPLFVTSQYLQIMGQVEKFELLAEGLA